MSSNVLQLEHGTCLNYRTVYMNMWRTAADNHTHNRIVNTEAREKQLYYYYALADDKTLVSAMPADESNLGDHDLTFNRIPSIVTEYFAI